MKLFTLLLLTLSLAFAQAPARKAPELAYKADGRYQLLSQYKGKVIALEFILTTCPHCQAATKVMGAYQRQYEKRGLQVIDIAINLLDDSNTSIFNSDQLLSKFISDFQVTFTVGYTTREQMLSFMGFSPNDRMVVPQLVLIDRDGFIRYQSSAIYGPAWSSVIEEPNLGQHIAELVNKPLNRRVRTLTH